MSKNLSKPLTIPLRYLSPRWSMMALSGLLMLGLLLISTGIPTASAQSPPDNVIGKVTNGTEGGIVPEDLEVLLLSIDLTNNQIIEQKSTTVDEDGIFRFDNLVSGPDLSYRVVANSGNYTPSVDLASVENWENVRLNIYDETLSLDDITISSYVMMIPTIDARNRQVGVLTVINVNNLGDEVWTPDLTDPALTGFDLLRFNLPDGFTDLSIESELPAGNILEIGTGFALTNPIPPGEAAILISYIVPYEGDSFEFTLKLPYGADQVRMLLPDDGGTISADGFNATESVVVAESVFNQFEASDFAVGDELVAKFSGLPQPTPLQQLSDFFTGRTYVIIIIWIVGIAFLAVLGYAMYSSRKKSRATAHEKLEFVDRASILTAIAALDEEHEAGNIDRDEYDNRREELKNFALEAEEDSPPPESDGSDTPEDETDPRTGEDSKPEKSDK